ncbi:MAG: PQQ-dependent sugar dehydrogenase [Bacteroidota bacterium]
MKILFSHVRIGLYCLCLGSVFSGCRPEGKAGGLFLPEGFSSYVVIDSVVGTVRHLAVSEDHIVYAKIRNAKENASVVALRDTDGDSYADEMEKFGESFKRQRWSYATAMRVYHGYLYYSSDLVVYRRKLVPGTMVPEGPAEIVMRDDHEHGRHEHIGKPIAFDDQGHMYVPFGAPSNACQSPKRTPGAPGLDPCPHLEHHAGIWRFDANKLNQTQKDGYHYASGIRSVVAMNWNPVDGELYVVMHGRDDLLRLWPKVFSPWQSAMLPSEEFLRVTEGSHFGWPYCYFDQIQDKKVLAPEYGGDGKIVGRCAEYKDPVIGFPGHWAPNDLVFYQGDSFPERYKNGAFIAFHGSTNRSPYPQSGYFVGFVPFRDGRPSGDVEIFADGFAQVDPIVSVDDALHRPMGLAIGPDGEMYISDSVKGKIWKVDYEGDKEDFGEEQLASMEERENLSHFRTPDPDADNLMKRDLLGGERLYYLYCATCHQNSGRGASGRFPPIADTEWVTGNTERLIQLTLRGLEGSITVKGNTYNGVMPQHSFLSDSEVAQVLTYIRSSFGNKASAISEDEVHTVREGIVGSGEIHVPMKAMEE